MSHCDEPSLFMKSLFFCSGGLCHRICSACSQGASVAVFRHPDRAGRLQDKSDGQRPPLQKLTG
jgi:hypothetical protein